ncbi:MAG: hypothetical protein HOV81_01500, partial [Kofleriaceae bacterium]|nr:hypothetical protein [Kofleriaceae bacterium]
MPPTSVSQKAQQGGVGGGGNAPEPQRRLQRSNAKVDRNQAQVGALMRTQAKRDLLSETKEERESWLQTKKDEVLTDLVDAATKELTDNLSAKMTKVVNAQKKQILESARVAVQQSIDASQHAGEKTDLKADTLVSESDAWDEAAGVATEEAGKQVKQHGAALKQAADPAFKVGVGVSLKTADRQKHLEKVASEAKKLIDTKAKEIETTLAVDVEKQTTKDRVVNAAKAKVSSSATTGVGDEIKARHDNNQTLESAVNAPVTKVAEEIRSETKTYLEHGLGAHGTGWFRSTQFKQFHAKMKEAARAKGHAMTDAAITEKRGSGGGAQGKKAEFEYQTAQAHILTHEAAKLELREIMTTFAGDLLTQTNAAVNVEKPLHDSGTAAAWAVLRNDPANKKNETAASKAATSAVKAAKPTVLKDFHDKAQELKNAYVKADIAADPNAQDAKNNDVISQKVDKGFDEREKDGEKFGKRMLRQAMEAPSAGKGLEMVGKLIDAATPQVGDETTLEVELKIPATHGAFCYFTVKGSAQRSAHMELGIEVGFGAGWETWGLSARGGFNVFLKAAAHDTVNAMQLIHYGAFRNLTHVSNSAANFWAGVTDAKKTASKHDDEIGKTEQAELWAAMTEERVFGKDKEAFVEVGGGI